MRTVISLQSYPSSDSVVERTNEEDPKHLKKVLASLIQKSKNIIATLEDTLLKLQRTEVERDFWKGHYFRFKESCHKYIEAKGLEPFQYICNLEDKVKNLIVQKECFNESRLSFNKRVEQTSPLSNNETTYKRKGPGHKSISTISFSKDNPHSTHKIVPKKINIFKLDRKIH